MIIYEIYIGAVKFHILIIGSCGICNCLTRTRNTSLSAHWVEWRKCQGWHLICRGRMWAPLRRPPKLLDKQDLGPPERGRRQRRDAIKETENLVDGEKVWCERVDLSSVWKTLCFLRVCLTDSWVRVVCVRLTNANISKGGFQIFS